LTNEEFEAIQAYNTAVNPIYHTVDIDFLMWTSDGAVLPELSQIKQMLLFMSAILSIGVLWLWVFRRRES
jgi:hypothetical protein